MSSELVRRLLGIAVLAMLAWLALSQPSHPAASPANDEIVAFNTETHKYHCPRCIHARKCTAHCIEIPVSEARKRGGVPCKVCEGTCGPP